jgi:hypothetical protein
MPPGRPGGALTAWPGWLSMSPDVPACMPGAVSSSPRTQENPIPARLRTCRDITRAQAGASAGRPAVLFLLSLRDRAPSPVSAGTSTPALTHRDEQSSRAPAQAEQIAEYSRLSAGGRHRRMVYRSARSGRRSALRRGSVVPTAAGWRGSLAITNAPAVSNIGGQRGLRGTGAGELACHLGSVRGSPKWGNTLLSENQVMAQMRSSSRVSTIIP